MKLFSLVFCSLFFCLAASAEPVDLSSASLPAGVRYGVDECRAVTDKPLQTQLNSNAADLADKGLEAFALEAKGDGWLVEANGNPGLMYGFLELRDRIKNNSAPTSRTVSSPALRLRGDTVDFPFYLGVNLYEGRWRGAKEIENSPENWWLDKGHWAWRLRRCAELRTNTILIVHPHPFPALVDHPDMPEAAYLDAEQFKRMQEHFKWLLDEAEQWGVKFYFLTWNIWVSPDYAKAHEIAQEGPDGLEVREYTRRCYRRLFEQYPKVAGVMTIAGEAPPGCVDFVKEGIVDGLNQLPNPPELMYWTWCSYPEDAKDIFNSYKGKSTLVHYLQYEQLFRPQADPRIKRSSEALGGVPVVTLGGLGTATGWLYWSDPYYIAGMLEDLPKQNGDGCFFQGLDSFFWINDKWLGWAGLARYWWITPEENLKAAPGRPKIEREDEYWAQQIEKHYETTGIGKDFLNASVEASNIPTRLLALVHRQTDHHHPQFGLPLTHFLGLPTQSTYVFENHESIDELGRLAPRMGLTYPNPDWGERVVGVVDYVAGDTNGTNPEQIADELADSANVARECVERLRGFGEKVKDGADKWNLTLDQMMLNVWLGEHMAAKIRAAVAWERWRTKGGPAEDVTSNLEQSVVAMEQMATTASKLYPDMDIKTFRSTTSRPWPWTNLQIWNLDQWRKHDWTTSAAMFRRELEIVKDELAQHYSQPLLPFEDDLVQMPENAKLILEWDCEGEPPAGLQINSALPAAHAEVGDGEAPLPISGKRIIAHQTTPDGFYFPIQTVPSLLPLKQGVKYYVTMDYWITESADALGDWLMTGARTTEGTWRSDIGARYMGGPAGTRGRITLSFTPDKWDDYYIYVSLHGKSAIELDNIKIRASDEVAF